MHTLHNLGQSRSVTRRDYLLQTPDTFVRVPSPLIERGVAVVHVSPEHGSCFTQYTAELETDGTLAPTAKQRFLYLLEGSARAVLAKHEERDANCDNVDAAPATYNMVEGSYAYLPEGAECSLTALAPTRLAVIEKNYEPHPNLPPPSAIFDHENSAAVAPLMGNTDLQVRTLLPDSMSYDFAVNTMTYAPGAALAMVEIHVMEHGLLMLEGGGIYRLGAEWYAVTAGDFIWMAPYCAQWFGAIGKQAAKYLIYKDFHRHPREKQR